MPKTQGLDRLHQRFRLRLPSWMLAVGSGLMLAGAANVLYVSCNPEHTGVGEYDPNRVLLGIEVTPNNEVLEVDLNSSASLPLTARRLYSDGSSVDITSGSTFALSNAGLGSFSGAVFTSVARATPGIDFATVSVSHDYNGTHYNGTANLTIVWLRKSGSRPDFFFSLPYQGRADKPLTFGTNIKSLDAFFAVDTTFSMVPEIQQLTSSLQTKIIPDVKSKAVNDAYFGVGAIDDFPYDGGSGSGRQYGQANYRAGAIDDQPFILLAAMTGSVATASNAVGQLLAVNGAGQTITRGNGVDFPESQLEALYQIATGAGLPVAPGTIPALNVPANSIGIGGVGFRAGALPVVTLITDVMFHTKDEASQCTMPLSAGGSFVLQGQYQDPVASLTHTRAETMAALNNICAKVIGVSALLRQSANPAIGVDNNGLCNANADLIKAATATGAVVPPEAWGQSRPAGCSTGQCCTGLNGAGEAPDGNGECPLVFKIPQEGTGLGDQVVSGITQVARYAKFNVSTEISGNTAADDGAPLPAGTSTIDFVKAVVPFDSTPPPAPPVFAKPTIAANSFTKVVPGSTLEFTVNVGNTIVPETDRPQVFRAKIKIQAGGCADLDEREVLILVPPKAPVIG